MTPKILDSRTTRRIDEGRLGAHQAIPKRGEGAEATRHRKGDFEDPRFKKGRGGAHQATPNGEEGEQTTQHKKDEEGNERPRPRRARTGGGRWRAAAEALLPIDPNRTKLLPPITHDSTHVI